MVHLNSESSDPGAPVLSGHLEPADLTWELKTSRDLLQAGLLLTSLHSPEHTRPSSPKEAVLKGRSLMACFSPEDQLTADA